MNREHDRDHPRDAGGPGIVEQATTAALTGAGRLTAALTGAAAGPEGDEAERGDGSVVLVGGYATTEPLLAPMAGRLERAGYDVEPFSTGNGIGCTSDAVAALTERVRTVAAKADGPVHLVGHSRGGLFARATGRRLATEGDVDLAGLVTLGTPFDVAATSPWMRAHFGAVAVAGSLGVPGLVGLGCLGGRCCADVRAEAAAPWPAELPLTSVAGSRDGVVPPPATEDPRAEPVVVDLGHLGLLTSPRAAEVVTGVLADHAGHPGRTPRAA